MTETPLDGTAVIGMAGRFPGAANVDALWQALIEGRECVALLDDAELAAAGVPPEALGSPDYVRARGVLPDVEMFDAGFFGMTPAEAALTPPEHRLLLECAWEALEGCGHALRGARVGVFAGAGFNTYLVSHVWPHVVRTGGETFPAVLANAGDHLATRVAYRLDLRGPCLTVQTACSTSLVAVHYACQSLAAGECDIAIAGGATVSLPQAAGYRYEEGGILSPDGRCRPFDAEAGGTVSANGAAVVVLRRLEDALADGDPVQAVIRGSAVNNDGAAKVGYTAPSVDGQAAVIAEALAVAGVGAETIGYVEAHGTGTALGDPIEVAALARVYDAAGAARGGCALGSLKGNLGHMDAAAGAAGLIKAVLALRHRRIPGTLHFREPNPELRLGDTPFHVNASVLDWTADAGKPRRAAVSSFGMGGTNAHVVLEEAPPSIGSASGRPWHLLPLSARSDAALATAAHALADALGAPDAPALADAAYTLQAGRQPFAHRRAVVCGSHGEGADALRAAGPARVAGTAQPAVAFLFPGQGSQHVGMGAGLYASEPTFRTQVDRSAEILRPHLGLDLRDLLYPPDGGDAESAARLRETGIAQPALFTIEYALACLWMEWGVRPKAMLGHSIGEYVAACVAGVFTLDDALALVALRGRLMQALPPGAMLSVPLPAPELAPLLPAGVSIAAENGPRISVASGPAEAVALLEDALAERGVRSRRLHTSHAFHSGMMEPALEAFSAAVARTPREAPRVPFISNLSGDWIRPDEAADPAYWTRHLRHTVRFGLGVRRLAALPDVLLLEVGPGQALCALVDENADESAENPVAAVPSMRSAREDAPDAAVLLTALGSLWTAGVPVDWRGYWRHESRRRVHLPTHPFLRTRHWIDAPPRRMAASTPAETPSTAAPFPLAVAAPPVALVASDGAEPTLESLVEAQLRLMSEQVAMLREETAAEMHAGDADATPVPLTPIQRWFFAQGRASPHHFNQALRFILTERVEAAALGRALASIVAHHEALRTRYVRGGDGWRAQAGLVAGAFALACEDLSGVVPDEREAAMEQSGAAAQAGLDLANGPVLAAVLYDHGPERPQHLLIAIHHLAVDIFSWGVLLGDLEVAYRQTLRGASPSLPSATPFRAWAERLEEHARTPQLRGELGLWLSPERRAVRPLPRDGSGDSRERDVATVEAALDAAETRALLDLAPSHLAAQPNDVLLAALGRALTAWAGGPVLVDVEGHGREDLFADVDTARTVGWFTALVPVVLAPDADAPPREAVARVRDRLRALPAGGIGHGLLRWLGDADAAEALRALPRAEVSFNYAGRAIASTGGGLFTQATAHATGPSAAPGDPRGHLLEVICAVARGRLAVTLRYSSRIHRRGTMEALAAAFVAAVRALLPPSPPGDGHAPRRVLVGAIAHPAEADAP